MTTTTLQQLQAKIQEACPELEYHKQCEHTCTQLGLVHVLRAVGELPDVRLAMTTEGRLYIGSYAGFCHWNLTKPLAEQSEEVISFLHGILCQ